jgi:hypothetical protein
VVPIAGADPTPRPAERPAPAGHRRVARGSSR